MPRPLYSKRLFAALGLTAAVSESPGPGVLWVIRDVQAYCNSGLSGSRFTLEGELGQAMITFVWPPNTTEGFQWAGRIVVPNGTSFTCKADDPTDVTVSGYELTTP